MTSAMKERQTMQDENSQGGYESVWKVKELFPKEMARVLRPEGLVGDT